jgi:predicted nucleotide-binding protein with TIR-like domain
MSLQGGSFRGGGTAGCLITYLEAAKQRIFIGHGRSPLWRELKDFIQDRLRLQWEEFNREPAAGYTTLERLESMLSKSAFAFLVMTAEEEHADSAIHARPNVIHEIGLFQGRLGPRRAIVLLEEGCSEFSNISGLGQIRFPKGDIAARFDEVRRVLEGEGLLRPGNDQVVKSPNTLNHRVAGTLLNSHDASADVYLPVRTETLLDNLEHAFAYGKRIHDDFRAFITVIRPAAEAAFDLADSRQIENKKQVKAADSRQIENDRDAYRKQFREYETYKKTFKEYQDWWSRINRLLDKKEPPPELAPAKKALQDFRNSKLDTAFDNIDDDLVRIGQAHDRVSECHERAIVVGKGKDANANSTLYKKIESLLWLSNAVVFSAGVYMTRDLSTPLFRRVRSRPVSEKSAVDKIEYLKNEHARLYAMLVRDQSEEQSRLDTGHEHDKFLADINTLLDDLEAVTPSIGLLDDYRWVINTSAQWQAFASLLNIDRRIRIPEPTKALWAPTKRLDKEDIEQWLDSLKIHICRFRQLEEFRWRLKNIVPQPIDEYDAKVYLAKDILSQELDFVEKIPPGVYRYLEEVWRCYSGTSVSNLGAERCRP